MPAVAIGRNPPMESYRARKGLKTSGISTRPRVGVRGMGLANL